MVHVFSESSVVRGYHEFAMLIMTEQSFLVKENLVIQEIHYCSYLAVIGRSPSGELTFGHVSLLNLSY